MEEHKILHINNSSMLFTYIEVTISFFLLISTLPLFHCQPLQPQSQPVHNYSTCKVQPYNCGPLHNISYPFWGHNRPQQCGGGNLFRLNCDRHQNTTTIQIGPQNFIVLHINTRDYTIQMKRTDLDQDVCSPQFDNTYLSTNLFRYDQSVENITIFYNCSSIKDFSNAMCGPQNAFGHVGNEDQFLPRCQRRIQVPAGFRLEPDHDGIISQYDLEHGLKLGFQVNYIVNEDCIRCLGSEGNCSNIIDIEKLVWSKCHYSYCPADGSIVSAALNCPVLNVSHKSKQLNWQGKIILGSVGAAFVGLFLCITIFCFKYKSSTWHEKFSLATKSDQDIEAFLKTHEGIIIRRYKFSDIKLMTYNFKIKIGQGGFGSVYKGELHNGSPVAVKMLKASKGNGKDFINEVASISRTSHINIVTILGFCFEDRKKALIYEFMPNGSLDKFIYNERPETIASLSWENLYQIAKGIAQGLEYLHRGCSTKILHFDIKPHNILLDEDLCPKISDFGLAKLCHRKEGVTSMSTAKGTIGYMAPEVTNKHFGGVSPKSDVYSYGMLLLDIVGVRKNNNAETNQTSEYFPDWIYKKLELGSDFRPNAVMATKENEMARGMAIVGLWCIQTIPNDRPTMSKVIEMLEGGMNSLEIPPKPVFSSPARSVRESSTS